MEALFDIIRKLVSSEFYGEIRVKFQKGRISHVEKEESLDVVEMRK